MYIQSSLIQYNVKATLVYSNEVDYSILYMYVCTYMCIRMYL